MNWKITATTLFCDAVKKWVPVMVHRDGRVNCGHYHRHHVITQENSDGFSCHGPQACSLCSAYKEDIFSRVE